MTICIALQSKRKKIPSYSIKVVSNIDLFFVSFFPLSFSHSFSASVSCVSLLKFFFKFLSLH